MFLSCVGPNYNNKPICYSVQLEFGLDAYTRLRDYSLSGGGYFFLQEIFLGGHHIHFSHFEINCCFLNFQPKIFGEIGGSKPKK